jgi:hypothetical protein
VLGVATSKKKYSMTWYYGPPDIHFGTYSFIFHYDIEPFLTDYRREEEEFIHLLLWDYVLVNRLEQVIANAVKLTTTRRIDYFTNGYIV